VAPRANDQFLRPMDMDLARRRLMAALAAVSTGKNLNDFISIPGGRGEKVVLLHALNDAAAYLADEYFDPDGLALAQRALVALNIHCFSTREGAVAKAILDAFMVRQPICRRKTRREA
jgi:hypothetical protein